MSSKTTTIEKCDKCGVTRTSKGWDVDREDSDKWLSMWRSEEEYDLCEKCADEFIKTLNETTKD
jgi:hypothetical protein